MDQIALPAEARLGFAHDLRNLLQTATAAISIIDRHTSDRSKRVNEAIAGARTSLERASELAVRSFDEAVRRKRSGLADVEECLADVRAILDVTSNDLVRVDMTVVSPLGTVRADPLELQNAILNLAINAIEAVSGAGRVIIGAQIVDEGAGVEIKVSDDGVGMSAQTARRAFEPGFTTKQDGVGGVGLATVERFVGAVGGAIEITSEVGSGTTVTMLLPAARPGSEAEETKA